MTYTAMDIIKTLTHHSLDLYKKRNSKVSIFEQIKYRKNLKYRNGTVFVSRTKENLHSGRGFVVTSYEALSENYNSITHFTPNTFRGGTYADIDKRYIQGHTRDNLKQVNVLSFDIDSKDNATLYGIFLGCDELELPRPNLIIETPNGYQGFFILEKPFYIRKDNDLKALKTAQRLSDNVRSALSKYVPIDKNCTSFGFFRVPNDENIKYFDEQPVRNELLLAWSKQFEKTNPRPSLTVITGKREGFHTTSEWYQKLITSTGIMSGFFGAGRNNALLTLALANYADGRSLDDCYNELDQFNSNLEQPLGVGEFERVLQSAYSGKYHAPKREHVNHILELWGGGVEYQSTVQGWYKFKKKREDRQRSHYDEREQDILKYVEAHTSPSKPFLEGSLKVLSELFGMALSTLKEVLKRSKKIFKVSKGRGRTAITFLTSRSMLFQHYLVQIRTTHVPFNQEAYNEVAASTEVLTIFDFPVLEEVIAEFKRLILSGSSPPTVTLTG